MTAAEFWSAYYGMPVTAADLVYPSATVEHVTLTGDPNTSCIDCGESLYSDYPAAERIGEERCAYCEQHRGREMQPCLRGNDDCPKGCCTGVTVRLWKDTP